MWRRITFGILGIPRSESFQFDRPLVTNLIEQRDKNVAEMLSLVEGWSQDLSAPCKEKAKESHLHFLILSFRKVKIKNTDNPYLDTEHFLGMKILSVLQL